MTSQGGGTIRLRAPLSLGPRVGADTVEHIPVYTGLSGEVTVSHACASRGGHVCAQKHVRGTPCPREALGPFPAPRINVRASHARPSVTWVPRPQLDKGIYFWEAFPLVFFVFITFFIITLLDARARVALTKRHVCAGCGGPGRARVRERVRGKKKKKKT